MTETTQGGPEKTAVAKAAEDAALVARDPRTGINKDMPSSPEKASGLNQDHGDRFCTSK